jgi:hypothetical protein
MEILAVSAELVAHQRLINISAGRSDEIRALITATAAQQ